MPCCSNTSLLLWNSAFTTGDTRHSFRLQLYWRTESRLRIIANSSGTELGAVDEMGGIRILSLLPVCKHYADMCTAFQINRQAERLCRQTHHAYHPNYMETVTFVSVINGLFNDAVSEGDHTAWNSGMISE